MAERVQHGRTGATLARFYNLRDLETKPTPAEALLIVRRRKGLNQMEMAKLLKVSMRRYTGWEYATRTHDCPEVAVLPLKNHEVCLLYRRRSKMSVKQVARELNCTPYWITLMERGQGNCSRLLEYWEC